MAYQPSKPLSTDKLNISQGDLLGNFTELNTFLTVNHNAFAAADGQGKHKFVTFPVQAAAAAQATLATEFGIYNTNNGGGNPALRIRKPGAVAGIDVAHDVDSTTMYYSGGAFAEYSVNLPSGLIIKGGCVPAMPPADHIIINYNTPFPNDSLNFQLTYAEAGGSGHDIYATYVDNTNFDLRAHHGLSVYWQAIGY